jgi:branched-chain amino acid transport system substrate-binding protein
MRLTTLREGLGWNVARNRVRDFVRGSTEEVEQMKDTGAQDGRNLEPDAFGTAPMTRRSFLKIAGLTGAAIGVSGGLGGLLAACGAEEATTTTAGATTTAGPVTTAGPGTTAGATTTVSAGPEAGRDIKLGLVSPKTGALALFAKADDWWTDFALKKALPEGVVCGDGKAHKFVIERQDSQSDSQRAAAVAGDLVSSAKVDMLLVSGSPETVNPVADQAEALATPCISNFVPWQPFYFGRQKDPANPVPFKWAYSHALGLEDIVGNFIGMWQQLETNKKVGFIFCNDADGQAWTDMKTGLPPAVQGAGYTYTLPGLYNVGTEDFSQYIAEFKKAGCEICCGTLITPDFTNFWKQAVQQNFHPKILTIGKALLFPQTLDAIGSIAYNCTVEGVWEPGWPYKDSITGKSCQELADDYMAFTGEQWTAPIGQYAKFEWAVDVFKRVKDLDDKEDIIAQVKTTKLQSSMGTIDFTAPVSMSDLMKSQHPVENVYKCAVGGAQWVKGQKFPFEPVMVSNVNHPDLPVVAKVQPMQYA